MPKRRVSLADLHRTAVGQGQALLGSVPAEAPRALGGFDTHGISQHTHPTVADISECLFFSPGDGRIWLQDQRMVLVHTEALGSLRRELIDSIGLDKARGLLTRAGYVSGARDARLVRQQWPDAEPTAAAMAGTRLHALEGVVQVEVVHARYNAELGEYDGEFLWHNSSEDDEHIAAYGVGGSPASSEATSCPRAGRGAQPGRGRAFRVHRNPGSVPTIGGRAAGAPVRSVAEGHRGSGTGLRTR